MYSNRTGQLTGRTRKLSDKHGFEYFFEIDLFLNTDGLIIGITHTTHLTL